MLLTLPLLLLASSCIGVSSDQLAGDSPLVFIEGDSSPALQLAMRDVEQGETYHLLLFPTAKTTRPCRLVQSPRLSAGCIDQQSNKHNVFWRSLATRIRFHRLDIGLVALRFQDTKARKFAFLIKLNYRREFPSGGQWLQFGWK